MIFVRKIATLNINAIGTDTKKSLLKDFLWNNDLDVAFLQEVSFENFSFIPSHYALVNISSTNKGTAILLRKNIDPKSVLLNPNGRISSIVFDNVNFINIYAHSGSQFKKERETFFTEDVMPHLSSDYPNVVLGDFNCILDSSDSNSNVKNICKGLQTLVSSLQLLDAEKMLNKKTLYTFHRGDSRSRLDRIYCTDIFLKLVKSIEILPMAFSDHHSVVMKYTVTDPTCMILQGRGFWKVNPSLVNTPEIADKFIQTYNQLKQQHCFHENFNQWWNINFKRKVKQVFRAESFAINEETRREKSFLYACLKQISNSMMQGRTCPDELAFVKSKLMEIEQRRLQNYRLKFQPNTLHEEEKIGFYQISSRLNKSSEANMLKLKINGCVTSDSSTLKNYLETHFKKLFEKQDFNRAGVDSILDHVSKSLTAIDKTSLTKPITNDELETVLRQCAKKKSPGSDGLTYEFYIAYKDCVKTEMLKLFNMYLVEGVPPPAAFSEGIISLIPKKGDPTEIYNRRPISMLNCDYKIFSKILMNRLQLVMEKLLGPGQVACDPEKSCITNLKLLRNVIIRSQQTRRLKGLLMSLDLEKAFDQVNHDFLWILLDKYNFPTAFIKCIQNMYNAASSRILFNGFLTSPIKISSSVRQGCPLSMALFVLYVEPLIRMIYNSINGVLIDDVFIKILAYADDITIFVLNDGEFDTVLALINYFSIYSKIKLNMKKSQFIRINSCKTGPQMLREVERLKVLGVIFTTNFKNIISENYDDLIRKMKTTVKKHTKRKLNLFQKVQILNCYILSKLWYVAQIFPAENKQIAQIRTTCQQFIFNSYIFKVRMHQLYLPVENGGLSLIDVESKMKALFIKNLIFIQGEHPVDNFMLAQKTNNKLPRNTREWIVLAEEKRQYDRSNTCNLIYKSLINDLNIVPKIETELPNINWQTVWQNMQHGFLSTDGKHAMFVTFNDIVPYKDKLLRHGIRGTISNICESCGKVDSSKHRIKECIRSKKIWAWVTKTMQNKMKLKITDPEEIICTKINKKALNQKAGLYLCTEAMAYNLMYFDSGSLYHFESKIREKRWNNKDLFKRHFGVFMNIC